MNTDGLEVALWESTDSTPVRRVSRGGLVLGYVRRLNGKVLAYPVASNGTGRLYKATLREAIAYIEAY